MNPLQPPGDDPHDYFHRYRVHLAGPDGQPLDIPDDGGFIGLLALGDLGTIAWRQHLRRRKQELARRTQINLAAE